MEWYDNFTSKDLLNLTNNNKEAADIIYMWYDNESAADDFESKADYIDFISDDIYNMLDSANTEEQQIVKSAIEKLKDSIRYRYYRYYLYIWSDSKKTSQIGSAKIFDYFKDAVNFAKTNSSKHPNYYYTIQSLNQIDTLAQRMSKDEFFKHTGFEAYEDIWNSIDGIIADNHILNLNKLLVGDKDELSKENTINNADDAVATLKRSVRGNFKESFNKTYQITVKYYNEPNAKIEARSAKDRKDLEYQLNMDDEVEWYDFDEKQFNESLDQMREKALKMKENSNAFAILYGYKVKDKEVELEPEEFATEEEYKERIQQITNSFTKLSDKDPRGNRYGHEHNIEFYTVYPNKKQVSESTAINNNWKVKKSRIDTKKIDSIINNLISSFPIIGSKPATIFKRHYKEKFVRYDIWLGHAGPGDAEAVEQKLLPSFEYLRDAVAPYGWKAFFEFSGYVGTDFFIQIRMPYETLENVAPIAVTESSYSDKNINKWNIGSDKSKLSNEEIALLDELAQKLESSSVNGYKYVVQHTYEDFGAGMQWYTIVCYDKKGDSWQVLDTKEWLQLMNTGDVDAVYSQIVSGEYFQDKLEEATLDEMNHRQLMSYMDSLD